MYIQNAMIASHIWASTQENLSGGLRTIKGRSACASAQTDQRLCYSLIGKTNN